MGSDFCDTCTFFRDALESPLDDENRSRAHQTLQQYREDAAAEFALYKLTMQTVVDDSINDAIHLIYDFAEKVLLPHLLRQPGQLHFVTGLKTDLFSVHSSNKQRSFVYCLPEGHWPGRRTVSKVAPMVYHNIRGHRPDS